MEERQSKKVSVANMQGVAGVFCVMLGVFALVYGLAPNRPAEQAIAALNEKLRRFGEKTKQ